LTHIALLIDFSSGHDFATLKFSFFLALICALLYNRVDLTFINREKSKLHLPILFIIIISIFISSVFSIYYYYECNDSLQSYTYVDLGRAIQTNAKDDEVVFISGDFKINPQTVYYSKRNIAIILPKLDSPQIKKDMEESTIVDIENAKKLIKLNNARRGIVFILTNNGNLEIKYIYP
jgi:hypothetical protein